MEHLSKSLKLMNLETELQQSQSQSLTTQTSNEISIYQGKLTKEVFAKETAKILQAFPKMPIATFNLLKDRFKDNGFTDERLRDAVNYVIDTYQGWDKLPNIANFISFDKKIQVFDKTEIYKKYPESYSFVSGSWLLIKGKFDYLNELYEPINNTKKYKLRGE